LSKWISLNDTLLVRPTVQEDMYSILLWLRIHQTAFTTDIAMWTFIRMMESCTKFCGEGTLMTYELATATYGTSSALYLATFCLSSLHKILAPSALMNNFGWCSLWT
jgi:hypothetical protein